MYSNYSRHSLVAGVIEAVVAAGTLILSSTFVIALAFPQPGYAQTSPTAGSISELPKTVTWTGDGCPTSNT
jgi:hypothetical protein